MLELIFRISLLLQMLQVASFTLTGARLVPLSTRNLIHSFWALLGRRWHEQLIGVRVFLEACFQGAHGGGPRDSFQGVQGTHEGKRVVGAQGIYNSRVNR